MAALACDAMGRAAKAWRWLKRGALLVLGLLLLYGVAVWLLPLIPVNGEWTPPASGVEIVVVSNGVHTDLVLPAVAGAVDWTRHFPRSDFADVDDRYGWISFGWGSREFYLETPTWSDLRLSTALRSVSGLAATALHVTWWWRPPEGERCRRFRVTDEQLARLHADVLATCDRAADGRPKLIAAPGYTACDRFYESLGHYSAITTCNEWTGARLRSLGVKCGCWTPYPNDVLRYLPK